MTEWYFDIETEGTDPQQDKILTIQYQPRSDGELTGDLQVLAEWEWGEKQIVRAIVEKGLLDPTGDFIPVGNRLKFDITFIIQKAEKYGIRKFTSDELRYYWFNKPLVDLAAVPVLRNRQRFGGSSIPGSSEKENRSTVARLYRDRRFADIIAYLFRERDETIAILREVTSVLQDFGTPKKTVALP